MSAASRNRSRRESVTVLVKVERSGTAALDISEFTGSYRERLSRGGLREIHLPKECLKPGIGGKMRPVAVEYIIPYLFHSRSSAAPVLFGKEFRKNDAFQLWGLHAWVWKEYPSGMFASWNPSVNCDNTTDVMAMAHN